MIARRLLALAPLLATFAPSAEAQRSSWRTVEVSRQLRDTLPQRIRVQYGAGQVDVRGSDDPLLYAMHLRYDETRASPLHRYDAEQRSALLGLESRGSGLRMAAASGDESGDLRLSLPRSVPIDLELELGGTQASLALGGLALHSLRLECGATEATVDFATANRARMREIVIDVGAAGLRALRLGNANAEQLRVRGGVGSVDLDFGGEWTRDLTVNTSLAIGKLTLRIPREVGLRLETARVAAEFNHQGLVKRADGWYSENWDRAPRKLRIRARTVFGAIEVLPSTH